MGCGTSRLEPGEEIPPGILHFRLRIHDLKRCRTDDSRRRPRERKDSIISTTELLRPEERDIDDYETALTEGPGEKEEPNSNGSDEADSSAMAKGQVEQSDEEGRRIGFGREHKEGDTMKEELPGSPSFRFYFADVVQVLDDGARADLNQSPKEGALEPIEEKELVEREGDTDCLVSGEGLGLKATNRKEKGRKFMTLPKANFLNVRGCYNMNSSSHNVQEGTRMLSEKAT